MARLHPGVYLEEVPSGVRPIERVSTSTAAFIGKAEMGTLNEAVLVTSMQGFETKYGTYLSDSFLAHAVLQFFNNGGKKCYMVRVAGSGATAAEIAIKDRKRPAPAKTLTIKAANEGAWGNKLDVVITDGTADPDNEFMIQVFKDRSNMVPPLSPLLLETHDDLSINPDADNFVEKAIAANSQYVKVEVNRDHIDDSTELGYSQGGKLPVGDGAVELKLAATEGAEPTDGKAGPPPTKGTLRGGYNPSIPLADQRKLRITINGDGPHDIVVPPDEKTGEDIAAAIQRIVNEEIVASEPANQPAFDNFTCVYEYDDTTDKYFYLLTSGTTGSDSKVSVEIVPENEGAISLIEGEHKFVVEINGDGPHLVTLNGPLTNGDAIDTAITLAVAAITPKRSINVDAFASGKFSCKYQNETAVGNPSLKLISGKGGVGSSVRVTNALEDNVAGSLGLGLTNGGKEITGAAALRPANSEDPTEYHLGDATISRNVDGVVSGDDGNTPGNQDYIKGLTPLDVIRDVNIICIPGIGSKAVVDAGSNYCRQRMDCFFIGDVNRTDDTVKEARDFVNGLTVKSSYGAIYYPWLKMTDPTSKSPQPIAVPPSGYLAGMYARIDAKRGVWKAPAGTEANIGGAVALVTNTTDVQQDFLNPIGVNVIRSFPASGLVIWGARTLATRSDPEYRYIPVRRTAIFLEQSIYNGIQWAVFEPNDEDLWASLRLNIGAFMMLQFRAGAFQGKTPNGAFFVKCDADTTTQADIDAGIVNILVGFAPLKPAEFVVLKLSQKAGQPTA